MLSKLQEFDAAMQTANAAMQTMVKVRTEIYSIVGAMPDNDVSTINEIPLTFYENGQIIAWGDDSEHFTPQTFRFVYHLWHAPERFLSKEDVRDCVQGDDESKPPSLRTCISRARQELRDVDFPYGISTVHSKGYGLTVQ